MKANDMPSEELVNSVIEQLKKDFASGDYTVLEAILYIVPKGYLTAVLSE